MNSKILKIKGRDPKEATNKALAEIYAEENEDFDMNLVGNDGKTVQMHKFIAYLFSDHLKNYINQFAPDPLTATVHFTDLSSIVLKKMVDLMYLGNILVSPEMEPHVVKALQILEIEDTIFVDQQPPKSAQPKQAGKRKLMVPAKPANVPMAGQVAGPSQGAKPKVPQGAKPKIPVGNRGQSTNSGTTPGLPLPKRQEQPITGNNFRTSGQLPSVADIGKRLARAGISISKAIPSTSMDKSMEEFLSGISIKPFPKKVIASKNMADPVTTMISEPKVSYGLAAPLNQFNAEIGKMEGLKQTAPSKPEEIIKEKKDEEDKIIEEDEKMGAA